MHPSADSVSELLSSASEQRWRLLFEQSSPIELTLNPTHPHLVPTIRNQGPGIPEEEQAQFFEGFFRGSNVGNIPGTGLGLAITHRCVELPGGTIALQSREANGAAFTVTHPLSP